MSMQEKTHAARMAALMVGVADLTRDVQTRADIVDMDDEERAQIESPAYEAKAHLEALLESLKRKAA